MNSIMGYGQILKVLLICCVTPTPGITGDAGNGVQIMCPGVRRPYHGEVTVETERLGTMGPYPVHTVIHFSCDEGYSGIGASRATCMVNGKWSNPAPYCVDMSCKRKPEYIEKGRKCRKKCEINADCNLKKFQRCLCDDWCGKSCYNPNEACPLPQAPAHGRVVTYGFLTYGQTITYECDDGHILSGEKTRRCRSDHKWTGYAPKCVAFDTCGQAGDTGTDASVGRIIRGKTAAIGAWPWQAVLLENNRYFVGQILYPKRGFGGGSVINKHWILTAGHVFDSSESIPYGMSTKNWEHTFLIVLGMTKYPTNGQTLPKGLQIFEPRNVFRHDSYAANIYHYDVALVKIGKKLEVNGQKFVVDSSAKHGEITYSDFIRPVCLPCLNGCAQVLGSSEFNETRCAEYGKFLKSSNGNAADVVVTGFGSYLPRSPDSEFPGKFPGALLQAKLRVLNDKSCAEALAYIHSVYQKLGESFEGQYTKAMICAQSADKKIASDACQGDSGGPLVRKVTNENGYSCWTQIGIVSWGMGCGQVDDEGNAVPGYYTDITSVLDWIIDTQLKEMTCEKPLIEFGSAQAPDILRVGSNISYSCNQGYEMEGPSAATCGSDGHLSESPPTCIEITCEKLSSPEHGSFFASYPLTYGSKIIYSCKQGFEIRGASTATCGTGGQLSELPPTCQRTLVYDGICPQEYERHKLMCYRIYMDEKSYSDAEETCMQQGARLAVVQSKSVNDYLYKTIPSTRWQEHTYWIGLKTTEWLSTWSSQAKFKEISDIAYNMRSLKKNGCGAYFYRGRGRNVFGSDMWHIKFNDCNSRNRFICEKWSQGTSSFKVDTPSAGLSGVYKPLAGLLTKEDRQVYGKTEDGSTKYLFYHWNKRTDMLGWFLGEYYVELSNLGPWIFKSKSDVQFPNLLRSQWHDANGNPVQVTISIAVNENVCPPVSSPEYGRIVVNPTNVGPPYTYGVKVSFICNPYYKTTGARTITCGRDGQWSGEPSECEETGCLLFQFDLNSGVAVEGHDGSIDAEKGDKFNLVCTNGKSREITCKGKDEWKPSVKSFGC